MGKPTSEGDGADRTVPFLLSERDPIGLGGLAVYMGEWLRLHRRACMEEFISSYWGKGTGHVH